MDAIDFYKAAKEKGIKPIIGCEVYVAPRTRFDKESRIDSSPHHLVLLCKNNEGYQNLIKIVSQAFIEGFYNKPRVDFDLLKKYSGGLIALSACLAGEIPRHLLDNNYNEAKKAAQKYIDVFTSENFFIELQNHGIREQQQILPNLVRLADELGVGLVATNDVHYIEKSDARAQNVLVCIQTNRVVGQDGNLEFPTDEFYLKSCEEMSELFEAVPQAIENTKKISDMCNVEFEFKVTKLPKFTATGGQDNKEYFTALCYEGLKKHYGDNPDNDVVNRLDYEISVISKMGYVDYYLIVHDFISYAKKNDIPVGPGRGSGAGSLAAFCIGITGIDPIKYNLLFERFLNPERISMPDFDVDFCYEKRQRVIDYVVDKYGADHVAQIITFGTMAAKGSIRDVGRALGMAYATVDNVAKLIPNVLNMTINKALEISEELKSLYENDEQIKNLIDMARKIEGLARHASTHAAGVVITDEPVSSYVPLQKSSEAIAVTQYTMTTLEELGLLKVDFLGLRNLTVIYDAALMIKNINPDFNEERIPIDDQNVFKMLSQGNTDGVFQFESAGMRQVLVQLKPRDIEDLIAVISLYRPGPMDSIPTYIENRHNPGKIKYMHPLLKPILEVTNGCIVYQEQVMQICRELAGYSYGRADLVRRAMSKKKADVMEKERKNFIYGIVNEKGDIECDGAVRHGVDAVVADKIFDQMTSFASYAFNKSHAAAYALLSYKTAYLKCYYPKQYMAALITSVLDSTDKVVEYINECSKLNVRIIPPHVNHSQESFTVTDDDINFGLLAVKNIGRGVIRELIDEREKNGKYKSFVDFCERLYGKELNKKAVEGLIKCGALDGLFANRRQMLMSIDTVFAEIEQRKKRNVEGQMDFFSASGREDEDILVELPDVDEFSDADLQRMEREAIGIYISGHPIDKYSGLQKRLKAVSIGDISKSVDDIGSKIKDGSTVNLIAVVTKKKLKVTKSDMPMAFIDVEDRYGTIEMIVFANVLQRLSNVLSEGNVIIIRAKVSIREDENPKLICENASSAEEYEKIDYENKLNGSKETLYLKVQSKQCQEFNFVLNVLQKSKGTIPVYVLFNDTNKLFIAPEDLWVSYNLKTEQELKEILGEKNVVLKINNQ